MNYYAPRQKKAADGTPSGVWHYTKMNDGMIQAVGYCADNKTKPPCEHRTPLEASQCYARYIKERCKGKLPGGYKLNEPLEEELIMASSY